MQQTGMTLMPHTFVSKELAYHREVLRGYSRTRVKSAELGGNQDMPFEQAFSNLAHAYLKDKAPSLLDYEVGFQLIDRNQENTKAIGAFGFKVGNQWLYAPTFFLNGDLKGHELLYVKNQDMFVPMKENWLNYILNRKPHILGESVSRNPTHLGIKSPNLQQLSRSPHKFASAITRMPSWAQDALTTFAHQVMTNPANDIKYAGLADLPTFLKKEGAQAVKFLLNSCKRMPKLASEIDRFYAFEKTIGDVIAYVKTAARAAGSDNILSVASQPGDSSCEVGPLGVQCYNKNKKKKNDLVDNRRQALKIAVYNSDLDSVKAAADLLTDKERTKLLQDGILIKDDRKDASVAYSTQTEFKLTNPTESGVYEVLVKAGKWEKCLVILGPHYGQGKKNFATIVRLDAPHNWLNSHHSNIWTKEPLDRDAWNKWYEEQTDVGELSKGTTYVIVGPNGNGTLPFTAEESIGDGEGINSYNVHFHKYCDKPRADYLPHDNTYDDDLPNLWSDGERIVLTGRVGGVLKAMRGDVYVPDGFKKIEISKPKKNDDGMCCGADGVSGSPPIQPGNLKDIQMLIFEKTSALKIYHNSTELDINGYKCSPLQGLIHLVRDHGFREKQARSMIKQAEAKKVARFRVKYADEYYDLQKTGPTAPIMPEMPSGADPMTDGSVPVQNMLEANLPVTGMSANLTDREIYNPKGPEPDYQTMQHAQQAGQSGQREVFDTAMIGSLIKATRDESMVDRWLPDIMKGMDRIARILMIFYWHQEEFADRYGKSELPELEDSLRNAFEAVGDILLALRQKTIDPYPDEMEKLDLGPVSNM